MKILAISGSTRRGSYNTALLFELKKIAKSIYPKIDVEVITLNNIPMFNQDMEDNLPLEVIELIKKASEANAFIISTPEYGKMIPGILKNTTEWLSRKYSKESVQGKPLAIIGASTGSFGAVRAQTQMLLLANILGFKTSTDMEMTVSRAADVFDEKGKVLSEDVRNSLKDLIIKFITSIDQLYANS